mgnify:CR=1 FL=1
METLNISLMLVILSAILITGLLILILRAKSKNQLQEIFAFDLICVLIISVGVILQEICSKLFNINALYFEKFIYIGTCFLPIGIYFTGLIFSKTKVKFKFKYLLLCIIPIITLCTLWTNDYHHLFFKYYSTNMSEIITGPIHTVNAVYSYLLLLLGVFYLLRYSIKNQGLFSKQSILILLGISIPVALNFLGTCKIIPMTVYVTPISFSLSMLFFAFAILKFQFLGATPIALQKIVDRMSDSYLVLNDDGNITDFNQTFLTTFKIKDSKDLRGQNFEKFLKENNLYMNFKKIKNTLPKVQNSEKTISFDLYIRKIQKHFHIEINSILSDGVSLGTLILFKDITQHIEDMQKIRDTQETLMEAERLSSLGQLIGGIAHNLKTPIMSISGAAEGLTDLVKEYDSSIDDPEVNSQDHHDIAKDMNEWIGKIKDYTAYMSDIITAVKGQAVTLSETENVSFDIDELVKRVDILMKHELKNALVYMNIQMKAPKNTTIHGDVNSLVQVINNMISNAIQSYNGKPEQNIDLILEKQKNNLIISVKDYGSGLPQKVKDKLFKEMITTKGKNGTGLGLYMSYSTIKAHFNGDITFESEENKGTTFNIILPL